MVHAELDSDSAVTWRDHDAPGSVLSIEQLVAFDTLGYCVVEGALTRETVRAVEREIDALERDRNAWLRDRPDGRAWISQVDVIDFAPGLVARSARLRQFSRSTPLTGICRDLIGPDVRLYFDQAVYKRPNTPGAALPFHQDNGYNFKRPEAYITIWIPLHDVDPDRGCLWVVPGIHRRGTLQHRVTDEGFLLCDVDHTDAHPVPVGATDLVVLSSLTPHATAGNRSGRMRKAYLLSYVPDGTSLRDGSSCCAPDTQYEVLRDGLICRD